MANVIPVLIIGAGPVGLTAAAMLTHYGVPVRIIDKKPQPTQTSNAVAVHARTLELLGMLGLTEKFIAAGRSCESMEVFANFKHLASINFKLIASRYNFVSCVPQNLTEQFLIEYLQEHNVVVERSTELLSMNKEVDKTVTVVTNKETLVANWLLACDGYHSKVREELAIPYEGSDMKMNFMMIDAPITWDFSLNSLYGFFNDSLSLALFPMKNSVRMIAEVSHAPQYINVEPSEKIFMEIADSCIPGGVKIDKLLWSSKFWIHERLAKEYIKGHVILAGDAAHAHSPAGGQGMNTGMHDAINVAWKLALIIQGAAHEKLLMSYQEERRPVAQQVLSMSGHMTEAALTKNFVFGELRNVLMPLLTKLNVVQNKLVGFIGETAVNYEKSSIIAGKHYQDIKPGDHSQYVDAKAGVKHTLLDFKGDANKLFADDKSINIVDASTLKLSGKLAHLKNVYCVLRPDFYIGYLGDSASEVKQYFTQINCG